ncbi:hypothetical protein [Stutzerimonas stutzeri]|uniref:hypothetical protein n=1 Tax=Stutzerimonas stutzeri TaxID=316 RepID=UPI001BD01DB6|nr:hypothetical protein [Stutzerimonas stutzeri]
MNATRQAKTGDHPRARLLLRLCAALGGGYICTVALTAAGALFATLLGMPRSEAAYLGSLLALPLYLALLLWSFCEPRLRRLYALLLGGTGAGLLLQALLNVTRAGGG